MTEESIDTITKDAQNIDLSKFQLTKVLSNDVKAKMIILLGKFPEISEKDPAILIFEKLAFPEENFKTDENGKSLFFAGDDIKLKELFKNDIYGNFYCFPDPALNYLKLSTVYPATEKHIEKYGQHEYFLVQESAELYESVTLKQIQKEQFTLTWVYNILEHKTESERIAFEDPDPQSGFILLPDLKWDGKTVDNLYLLAICFDRNIKSIRDLNGSHLPLLRNIREKGLETIETKYGVSRSQIRAYFHYQPSFYHLHVHFSYIKFEVTGGERNHLLDTVINNIELVSDYYQKSSLTFLVRDNDKLFDAYKSVLDFNKKLKAE